MWRVRSPVLAVPLPAVETFAESLFGLRPTVQRCFVEGTCCEQV